MTKRPPMHVLTNPEAWGLIALAPSGSRSRARIAIFGEYVRTIDDRVMVFAGCDAYGEPLLIPANSISMLPGLRDDMEVRRVHHESISEAS